MYKIKSSKVFFTNLSTKKFEIQIICQQTIAVLLCIPIDLLYFYTYIYFFISYIVYIRFCRFNSKTIFRSNNNGSLCYKSYTNIINLNFTFLGIHRNSDQLCIGRKDVSSDKLFKKMKAHSPPTICAYCSRF